MLNVYGPGISILFVVFVEAAGVCWFYGVDRFSHDVEKMIGHRPGIFWRVCWNYISPVFLLVSHSYGESPSGSSGNSFPLCVTELFMSLLQTTLRFSILSGHLHFFAPRLRRDAARRVHVSCMDHHGRMGPNGVLPSLHPTLHSVQADHHAREYYTGIFTAVSPSLALSIYMYID